VKTIFPFSHFICSIAVGSLLLLATSCDEPKTPAISDSKKESAKSGKSAAKAAAKEERAIKNSTENPAKIEAFTGAHTRIVWAENQAAGHPDSFARGTSLILKGIDTQDGKGERKLLKDQGNYSRPILSTDGETILYTDKNIVREKNNKNKTFDPIIYKTDWHSGKPTPIAKGYAVDCWRDPVTKIEWVYATKDLLTTNNVALEASALVRFPLDSPEKVEVLYNDTIIGPDNIQVSRDGTRASGQFPWPHTGIFRVDDGKWTANKLQVGCWPSLAPDNSGISWVFDGEHRSATFFDKDGIRSWKVRLNTGPNMKNQEVYHPRWSNHSRFIVITGPYMKQKGSDGSVINKGGASAQIYLAKFNETATEVEDWLQITGDKLAESYPDLWIKGGETAELVVPSATAANGNVARNAKWPTNNEGLLFLWENRDALNNYRSRDGQMHTSRLELHLAARYGRYNELLLGGGTCTVESSGAAPGLTQLKDKPDATFEAVVLRGDEGDADGSIFRGPHLGIGLREGNVVISTGATTLKSKDALPDEGCHLAVTKSGDTVSVFINGKSTELLPDASAVASPEGDALIFGGDWSGGLLHVALYDQALSTEEVNLHAEAASIFHHQLSMPPLRVRLQAKLVEVSSMPTPEGIDPYTSSLVVYVYEVEKVLSGEFSGKSVLVKHWAMLDQKPVVGLPREIGQSYELTLEKEAAHTQLKGERTMDDTTVFDMEPWFDVTTPRVLP